MSSFDQTYPAVSEALFSPGQQSYHEAIRSFANEHVGRPPKRARISKACQTCRKRKISCSGDKPCKRCREDGHLCQYNDVDGRTTRKDRSQQSSKGSGSAAYRVDATTIWKSTPADSGLPLRASTDLADTLESAPNSRNISRGSVEAGMIYDDDQQHTGPTSGLAFLQQAVHRIERNDGPQSPSSIKRCAPKSASIFTSGDMPIPPMATTDFEMPDEESSARMLSRYFDFATPTYRFFHRPTVEGWAKLLLNCSNNSSQDSGSLTLAREAAVYLIWAQALEYRSVEYRSSVTSNSYFEKARVLLDKEPGPPRLESIQARLASCLYLLSTSRINECWYRFGMTTLIVMALGLHRRNTSQSPQIGLVELECQKRAFWSAYILDRYLSVMKGRPRVFRDEDIDQEYPANVSDDDLIDTERRMLQLLPPHGLLEATVHHAKLTSIMGRATDLLYPLQPLPADELLVRAEVVTESLNTWEESLPYFLKPTQHTLTGQRIFERQNTVLKLSHAHVRIVICRQFLLRDFATLGHSKTLDSSNHKYLNDCMNATYTILDTVDAFIKKQNLIRGFWFTQYIALCAISTFYIYIIHYNIGASNVASSSGRKYFEIAERCQQFLASIALEGSPSKRYQVLLAQLRHKARRAPLDHQPPRERNAQEKPFPTDHSQFTATQAEAQTASIRVQDLGTVENRALRQSESNNSMSKRLSLDDLGGNAGEIEIYSTHSESMVDFDNLNLSWEFLDQLALPENFTFHEPDVW